MNCKICKNEIKTQGFYEELRERLEKNQVCHSCDFWVGHWQDRNDPKVIRAAGNHYRVVNDGTGFEITVLKDRKLKTVRVWHQGTIPAVFRDALPDNAKFAHRIGVVFA